MSHFADIALKITGAPDVLVEALCEMGWTKDMIEVHDERQHLYGYRNDQREQKAHIIVRRKNVCHGVGRLSSASNDIGFERNADGSWKAHVSEYDKSIGFNAEWQQRLLSKWAICRTTTEAKKKGWSYSVNEAEENGKRYAYVTINSR